MGQPPMGGMPGMDGMGGMGGMGSPPMQGMMPQNQSQSMPNLHPMQGFGMPMQGMQQMGMMPQMQYPM